MNAPSYAVVIATMDRPEPLREVLDCLEAQTHPPSEVIVVDASETADTANMIAAQHAHVAVRHRRVAAPSAARQRNDGGADVKSPFIAFMDDDINFGPAVMSQLVATLAENPAAVGVAARIDGPGHPPPGPLLRFYYRLQAGYPDPHYGGRLFGAAINCFPCYGCQPGPLVESEWLNSGLVLYRTPAFQACRFPDFQGYSFMEDVYLSANLRRQGGRLFFRSDATYIHYDLPNRFKRDARELARHRMINRARVARDLLGLSGWRLHYRLLLHRLFVTASLLRARPPQWRRELRGTWV